ncbi:MAG: glycosyltransferase [Candidatus Aenigmatarchaeota archaeon]
MKIAVVIPLWNGEKVIGKTLASLKKQTLKVDKIIIVDNASTDNSVEFIRKNFPEVIILKNKINKGPAGGYADGMRYAYKKGYDFIWLLDQDSNPTPQTLEIQLKCFNMLLKKYKKPSIVAPLPITKDGRVYTIRAKCLYKSLPFEAYITDLSGMLIHRDIVNIVGFPLEILFTDAVDWEYSIRVRYNGFKIFINPKASMYHRRGTPVKIRLPIKNKIYKVRKRDGIVATYTNTWLIGRYPPFRYYNMGRSETLLLWHPFFNLTDKLFILKQLLRKLIKIQLFENEKSRKTISLLKGIIAGIKVKHKFLKLVKSSVLKSRRKN